MILRILSNVQRAVHVDQCIQEPTSELDTFVGYQIIISPAAPPPLNTPILQSAIPRPLNGLYFHLIEGLSNFTQYTITVTTYNSDGVGPLTARETITTPEAG